ERDRVDRRQVGILRPPRIPECCELALAGGEQGFVVQLADDNRLGQAIGGEIEWCGHCWPGTTRKRPPRQSTWTVRIPSGVKSPRWPRGRYSPSMRSPSSP